MYLVSTISTISAICLTAQAAFALTEPSPQIFVTSDKILSPESISATASPDAQVVADETAPELQIIPATSTPIAQDAIGGNVQAQPARSSDSKDQVTSVSELSDVQPTDWAFQALQSLVERYGCISGYPNSTYRGNRALTRYEFAAGLSACLDRVNELIATATTNLLSQEDLISLQRLQEEFSAELSSVRGRVDTLEAATAQLEANQFSTSTRLTGQVVWAINAGGFSGDRIVDPRGREVARENPNATTLYRASLDLNTSFRGDDLLKIRLNTGSDRAIDNAAGFLEPNLGSFLEFSLAGTENQFSIARLHYTFTPITDVAVTVGTVIASFDFVDRNSYANLSFRDFSTQALVNNFLLLPLPVGSGAFVEWNPQNGPFTLRALYLSGDASNPNNNTQSLAPVPRPVSPFVRLLYPGSNDGGGAFKDPYQGVVELQYAPSKTFAVRLQYSGGSVFDGRFDVFGVNFELALAKQLAIFGRYGYGSFQDTTSDDINPNYWMAGLSFPDLFVEGALAGIAVGQPFIDNTVGNATQTNLEAFYNFPISNQIRVTPLVQVILDPANQSSNGTIVTGTLRTVLSF